MADVRSECWECQFSVVISFGEGEQVDFSKIRCPSCTRQDTLFKADVSPPLSQRRKSPFGKEAWRAYDKNMKGSYGLN